jgi:aerotaxis receptor
MSELHPDFPVEARKTSAGEVSFAAGEMFFSRTDRRGVIQTGNSVFARLSGYDWGELTGAPHKIIRHADMPKGVFQLMWDRLKAGQPTGCYVKNRSKDGRYYWVFALVAPCGDGYLSERIKPSSPLFDQVRDMYKSLLEEEQGGSLDPKASSERLMDMLAAAGFANYDMFQASAIAAEHDAKCRATGTTCGPLQARFAEMSRAIADVETQTTAMTEVFSAIRTVPMNMSIIASRLENAGGPISAISVNYSQMLEEMTSWVKTFVSGEGCVFSRIRDAIMQGQFLCVAAAISEDMTHHMKDEDLAQTSLDVAAELLALSSFREDFMTRTARSLMDVEAEARRFARSIQDMKRYVTGLSSTRMMCKIESASLSESGTALSGIVDQLDAGQKEIEAQLARIVELNAVIQGSTSMLRTLM